MVTAGHERGMQEASEAITTFQELKLDTEGGGRGKERIQAMSDAEKEKFGHERRELIAKYPSEPLCPAPRGGGCRSRRETLRGRPRQA